MPNNSGPTNHDWENEMSSEFDRRVRDLHEAPLNLANVKGTAMNIQRKRRIAVAGGILAAAAVIVPVGIIAGNNFGDDKADSPGFVDSSSPTITDSPTDVPSIEPTVEPTGAPDLGIGVGYIEGADYHRPDGSVFELPDATYMNAATLGDRVVAWRQDDNGNGFVDVIEGGDIVTTYNTDSPFLTTSSGETVAFLTTDGELQTIWSDDQVSLGNDFGDNAFPVAVSGGPNCYDAEIGGDGCQIAINVGFGETEPFIIDSHGIRSVPDTDVIGANDIERGLATYTTSVEDAGSCGGLYDFRKGDFVFETCDYTVGEIAPGGQYVAGLPPYLDGLGTGNVSILDTDGTEVARYAPEGGFVGRTSWVDGDTLAATVYGNGAWQIVLLTVGGEIEVPVGPTPGEDFEATYQLTY